MEMENRFVYLDQDYDRVPDVPIDPLGQSEIEQSENSNSSHETLIPTSASKPLASESAQGEFLQPIETSQSMANRLLALGSENYQAGRYEAALDLFKQAYSLYQATQDDLGQGRSLSSIGLTFYSLKHYSKAIEYSQSALVFARHTGDRPSAVISLSTLGNAYRHSKEPDKAIESQLQSLSLAKDVGDRPGEMAALNNLGLAYKAVSQYEQAIFMKSKALSLRVNWGHSK